MDINAHNQRLQMFDFERPEMRKARSLILLRAPRKIIEAQIASLSPAEKMTIQEWQEYKDNPGTNEGFITVPDNGGEL